jgi:hypothetical protein
MNTKVKMSIIDITVLFTICGLISCLLSGCGFTGGWEATIGVHPITAVKDERGLNQKELDPRRPEFSTTAR